MMDVFDEDGNLLGNVSLIEVSPETAHLTIPVWNESDCLFSELVLDIIRLRSDDDGRPYTALRANHEHIPLLMRCRGFFPKPA